MYACEITLQDTEGKPPVKVEGVIFSDQSVYVNDPVARAFCCVPDMLSDTELDITGFKITGHLIPLDRYREFVESQYNGSISKYYETTKALDNQLDVLKRARDKTIAELDQMEAYSKPVTFLKTETGEQQL